MLGWLCLVMSIIVNYPSLLSGSWATEERDSCKAHHMDNPCLNGGTCRVHVSAASDVPPLITCRCQPAWTGSTCELQRDPCTDGSAICGPGWHCVRNSSNIHAGYDCSCAAKSGWRRLAAVRPRCVDIDECALLMPACYNGGRCRNKAGTFSCECQPGFRGKRCRDLTDVTGWSGWGLWSACDVPCGRGRRQRSRACLAPQAAYATAFVPAACRPHHRQTQRESCQGACVAATQRPYVDVLPTTRSRGRSVSRHLANWWARLPPQRAAALRRRGRPVVPVEPELRRPATATATEAQTETVEAVSENSLNPMEMEDVEETDQDSGGEDESEEVGFVNGKRILTRWRRKAPDQVARNKMTVKLKSKTQIKMTANLTEPIREQEVRQLETERQVIEKELETLDSLVSKVGGRAQQLVVRADAYTAGLNHRRHHLLSGGGGSRHRSAAALATAQTAELEAQHEAARLTDLQSETSQQAGRLTNAKAAAARWRDNVSAAEKVLAQANKALPTLQHHLLLTRDRNQTGASSQMQQRAALQRTLQHAKNQLHAERTHVNSARQAARVANQRAAAARQEVAALRRHLEQLAEQQRLARRQERRHQARRLAAARRRGQAAMVAVDAGISQQQELLARAVKATIQPGAFNSWKLPPHPLVRSKVANIVSGREDNNNAMQIETVIRDIMTSTNDSRGKEAAEDRVIDAEDSAKDLEENVVAVLATGVDTGVQSDQDERGSHGEYETGISMLEIDTHVDDDPSTVEPLENDGHVLVL